MVLFRKAIDCCQSFDILNHAIYPTPDLTLIPFWMKMWVVCGFFFFSTILFLVLWYVRYLWYFMIFLSLLYRCFTDDCKIILSFFSSWHERYKCRRLSGLPIEWIAGISNRWGNRNNFCLIFISIQFVYTIWQKKFEYFAKYLNLFKCI